MIELLKMVGVFLFGAGGLAIINIMQERWKWKADRRAKIEDRKTEENDKLDEISKNFKEYTVKQEEFSKKMDERLEAIEKKDKERTDAMKYVLLDRIICIGQSYIKHGEVGFDERKRLREMHHCYHSVLGGNGDADFIMNAVDELPLKQ